MLASSREPRAAANTPCRGRFHIGPACPAADPRRRAVALPCKPGQTLRSPGLPGTQNLPVGAGFIPPAEPHAAANTPGRCEHRPLHGFAMATGVAFPGWPPHLGDSKSGRSRRRRVRRDEGIPPYVRPGGRGNPVWPVVPGRHVGEGHAPPEPPRRREHPGTMRASSRPALPWSPRGRAVASPANRGKHCGCPVCLKHKICP